MHSKEEVCPGHEDALLCATQHAEGGCEHPISALELFVRGHTHMAQAAIEQQVCVGWWWVGQVGDGREFGGGSG